ncbi:MAG: UDP-N-acetylmuramoyl-L-alanine--D-glutamate ligase [Ruminococcaceae bacterium]|nr:UDP-N-acetylmuramoyl-L-alanine--D-glutamate ligase [Oscillospiraceae bacterium]
MPIDLSVSLPKSCAVVGLGVSNLPLVRFLCAHGVKPTVRDRKEEGELASLAEEVRALGAALICGEEYLQNLHEALIFRSPGMRPDLPEFCRAAENGSFVTSEMEWFLRASPALTLGITGSDGKTTTTTLTGLFLEEEKKRKKTGRVYVGGNIGAPLLPHLEEMSARDFAVVELSSFQLQGIRFSPDRAAITNLSPNHLNWHTDFSEYVSAKTEIFKHERCKLLVLNADNAETFALAERSPVPVTFFSAAGRPRGAEKCVFSKNDMIFADFGNGEKPILPIAEIRLPGKHNLENYLTAIALTEGLVSTESIAAVAKRFCGVAHRLQKIRTVGGVTYYNSSIDSTPTRTRAALSALCEQGIRPVVICGGYDKHLSYAPLAEALEIYAKSVVLTGQTARTIAEEIEKRGSGFPFWIEPDFRVAVEKAKETAQPGDVVLLSPACASFDAFRDFAERGEVFCRIVNDFSEE